MKSELSLYKDFKSEYCTCTCNDVSFFVIYEYTFILTQHLKWVSIRIRLNDSKVYSKVYSNILYI